MSVKERHGNSEGKNGDNLTGQFTGEGRDRKSRKLKKVAGGHGIPGEEICKMEKLENAGKQFDSETMTRYNASRDYIALYLAREQ